MQYTYVLAIPFLKGAFILQRQGTLAFINQALCKCSGLSLASLMHLVKGRELMS